MERIENTLAWPAAWPTNIFAIPSAQSFINKLARKYPSRVITKPIPFVNSASDLLAESLDSPSAQVRRLARKVLEALEACERSLEIDPSDPAKWGSKGQILALLSETAKAEAARRRA